MHIDRAGLAAVVHSPYFIEQLVTGEGDAGVGEEQPQQFIFLVGQTEKLSIRRHGMRVQIHRQPTCLQTVGVLGRPAAAQHSFDARDKFHHTERLGQIIVRTKIQSLDLVIFSPLGRRHHHRDVSIVL